MSTLENAVQALALRDQNHPTEKAEKVNQEQISDMHFERIEVIGKGAYSTVVSAKHIPSGSIVALKEIPLAWIRGQLMREQLKREINVHRTLRHAHIVRMYSYYFTDEFLVIVMELCARGTLRDRLEKEGLFSEKRACRYTRQTARAIHHLHSMEIAHRDVKLENILLDNKGVVKLADFGWSRNTENDGRKTICGTLDYLSPEMLSGGAHNNKTDVWSLGVALVEMMTGSPPFYHESEHETLTAIREGEPQLTEVSHSAREVISGMLQKDPQKRWSMEQVLAHPWISHDKILNI